LIGKYPNHTDPERPAYLAGARRLNRAVFLSVILRCSRCGQLVPTRLLLRGCLKSQVALASLLTMI